MMAYLVRPCKQGALWCQCECDRCKHDRDFFSKPHPHMLWRKCSFCGDDIAGTVYDHDAESEYVRAGLGADDMIYICFCCDMVGKLRNVNSVFVSRIPEVFA